MAVVQPSAAIAVIVVIVLVVTVETKLPFPDYVTKHPYRFFRRKAAYLSYITIASLLSIGFSRHLRSVTNM